VESAVDFKQGEALLKLIIVDDEGRRTIVPFVRQEITIGRQEGNTIRLTERNVSRHHARLLRQNGAVVVEDLGSYNGVRVNGARIEGVAAVGTGDRVQIGDYELAIDDDSVHLPDRSPTRELEKRPEPAAGAASTSARQSDTTHAMAIPSTARQTERPPAPASAKRPTTEIQAIDAPRLVVLNTDLAGREFACVRSTLMIGRSAQNELVLDHVSLAQTHARMMREASGDWQIVDLDSSNGMLVNGEAFGKARLRDGDLLQLGEVKLKFVASVQNEAARRSRELSSASPKRKWLIAAVVLLLAVVGAAYVLTVHFRFLGGDERVIAAPKEEPPPATVQATQSPPIQTEVPEVSKEKIPTPSPGEERPTSPPRPPPQLDAKLRMARTAITRRDFQKAVDILDPLKSSDGSRQPQVMAALVQANTELAAKKNLALAQKSLSAGKLDETMRLLEESSDTVAFAKERDQLKVRAEALRRRAARKNEKAVKPVQQGKPAAAEGGAESEPARGSPPGAEKLYDEGTDLYRKGQYTEAASTLNQCLKVDPSFAKCHMVLGSIYAKLKEPELGAQHYRQFVQLAPNDPETAKVQVFLEQYESSRAPGR
jgi:pSer/pThr/pTyr-binding forkhead associated (FHA) protein/TolA-binding protein